MKRRMLCLHPVSVKLAVACAEDRLKQRALFVDLKRRRYEIVNLLSTQLTELLNQKKGI